MLRTEEEARKCWCPFARVMNIKGEGGGNRWDQSGAPDESPCGCIASECMAWRLLPAMWKHRNSSGGTWTETKETDDYGRKGEPLPRVGFCGLAGAPHD